MATRGSDRKGTGSRGLTLLRRDDRVEASLWRRLREAGEEQVRTALFAQYQPTANRIAAGEYAKRRELGVELGEIRQLAYEGLLQAIGQFDPVMGVPFAAFARRRIRGNILDGLARADERSAQYRFRQRAERDRLRSLEAAAGDEAGSDPLGRLGKLATLLAIGLMLEDHAPVDPDDIPAGEPGAYETLAWAEMHQRLFDLVGNLAERDRFILVQHYQHDMAFSQIAGVLGLTKGRISQLHKAALLRLREELERFR